jgi:hypothetical protein
LDLHLALQLDLHIVFFLGGARSGLFEARLARPGLFFNLFALKNDSTFFSIFLH